MKNSKPLPYQTGIHLIRNGVNTRQIYDTETVDLGRWITHILEYSGGVSDLRGNTLRELSIESQLPPQYVPSPMAMLVTDRDPSTFSKGVPPHIFAGQVIDFIKTAHLIYGPDRASPDPELFSEVLPEDDDASQKKNKKTSIHEMPVIMPDGRDAVIQFKDYGRKILLPEDGRWRDGRALSIGKNNVTADDPWLWQMGHRVLVPNIFFTHTRYQHKLRRDLEHLAQMVFLFGPQGEYGLQPGWRIDPQTGQEVHSFKLKDLMVANTRLGDERLGVPRGVLMRDGTQYNVNFAHIAQYDKEATEAFFDYMDSLAPETVRFWEQCADRDFTRNFLFGINPAQPQTMMRPLISFGRRVRARPTKHMGIVIDDDLNYDYRQYRVLILNLDRDPHDFRFEGKLLHELDTEGCKRLLQQQLLTRRDEGSLFEVLHLNRGGVFVDGETGYKRGAGFADVSFEKYVERRAYFIEHDGVVTNMMTAFTELFKRDQDMNPRVSLPHFHLFYNVGEPDYILLPTGKSGQTVNLPPLFQQLIHDVWRQAHEADEALREVVQPHRIEWDAGGDEQKTKDALEDLRERLEKAEEKLRLKRFLGVNYGSDDIIFPEEGRNFDSQVSAVAYLWNLRLWSMNKFNDYSKDCRFLNPHGQIVPFEDIANLTSLELKQRRQDETLLVEFDRIPYLSPMRLLEMFFTSGKGEWFVQQWSKIYGAGVGEEWAKVYAAYQSLLIHGEPDKDPSQHSWMSAPKALWILDRIEHNDFEGISELGLYDIFVQGNSRAHQILADLRVYYEKLIRDFPQNSESLYLMGYDPVTRRPIENIEYEFGREDAAIIDVPVTLMKHVLRDEMRQGRVADVAYGNFLLLDKNTLSQDIGALKDKPIILRCPETGMHFHATITHFLPPPQPEFYPEVYRKAEVGYRESGMHMPATRDLILLSFEQIVPLANWRPMPQSLQVIEAATFWAQEAPGKIRSSDQQDEILLSFICPRLSGRTDAEKPQGIILPVQNKIQYKKGPARLCGVYNGCPTGHEFAAEISKPPRRVTLKEMRSWSDEAARLYGYRNRQHMIGRLSRYHLDAGRQADDPQNEFWVLNLAPVDKTSWLYADPSKTPISSITRDYSRYLEPEKNKTARRPRRRYIKGQAVQRSHGELAA
jgi:hypothetical protein